MSEKDKNTIIIAAIALLIFGIIMLGIKPGITNFKEAKAKNEELSATKQEMQTQINALPTLKTELEAAKADYATTAGRVYGDLTNDKIHDEVVKMVQDLGLEITNFSVGDVAPMGISPYAVNDGVGAGGVAEGSVKLANVTATVFGNNQQIISFIDYINKTEGLYLQTVSFSNVADATSASVPFYMVLADTFD